MIRALTPAFVLHSYPYRNTSAVLELLTLDAGRVGVVARSARGPRSRSRAFLQPFVPLLVSWGGRGELGSLRSIEERSGGQCLPPNRLPSAFYLNELLVRLLLRGEPVPRLFQHYEDALVALCAGANQHAALRRFERELLVELGVGLVLDCDSGGVPLDAESWYRYQSGSGPIRVREPVAGPRGSVSGCSLLAFARDELTDVQVLKDVRTITRQAVAEQLGERPLRSRELLPPSPAARPRNRDQNLS